MVGMVACTPVTVVTGVGAAVGNLALQDRRTEHALADITLKANITKDLTNRDTANFFNLGVDVFEGRVMLTGTVPADNIRVDAASAVWNFPKIREVINEIQIGVPVTTQQKVRDKSLEVEISTRLTFTREIKSVNYITTVTDGVVYIMGIALTDNELQAVINSIKEVKGVREIISHVQLSNDPARLVWLTKNSSSN